MKQKIDFINNGRSGYVVYEDGEGELKFYYEFGGADCVAIIFVPSVNDWTDITKRKLSERHDILNFVAEESLKIQAPNCKFVISDNSIEIYSK